MPARLSRLGQMRGDFAKSICPTRGLERSSAGMLVLSRGAFRAFDSAKKWRTRIHRREFAGILECTCEQTKRVSYFGKGRGYFGSWFIRELARLRGRPGEAGFVR